MNAYCEKLNDLRSQPTHELKEIGDEWRTPEPLFWGINAMFGPLVLDLFTDGKNSKCPAFYTAEDNALTHDWSEKLEELHGAAFGNPPYSRAQENGGQYITGMRHIMAHTINMRERGGRYVFLIKAATSEAWWPEQADHIAFIRGRVGFDVPEWFVPANEKQIPTGAFFAGAIAIFDKDWRGPAMSYVKREQLEAQGNAFLAQIRSEAERLVPQKQPQVTAEIPAYEENRVWPLEVGLMFEQVPQAVELPPAQQNKLKSHINRMWLERMPSHEILAAVASMAESMGSVAA
ncbi:phage N-6-adenine-methyltransferase [Serratia sp. DD3]|uniref:phage N-6-adenine-methyltransferase n=1 Tax=Serratia sp. DD3 TaxID=1410619 RepID=UPI0003C4EB03|nr:phage N-6-adenine-methyltransferase [Serratia sp. DD3]KEY58478.1 phage N-6-adenine-methyltransferase [Serratia sp. DD3]